MARPKANWKQLEAEFLASDKSLTEFQAHVQKTMGITRRTFYRWACAEKWKEKKQALQRRAAERVVKKAEDELVKRWGRQIKLWEGIEAHVAATLRRSIGPDGRIVKPLKPGPLKSLADTLSQALKSLRLIYGESTENVDSRHYHKMVVDMVERFERGDPDVVIPGEVVDDAADLPSEDEGDQADA